VRVDPDDDLLPMLHVAPPSCVRTNRDGEVGSATTNIRRRRSPRRARRARRRLCGLSVEIPVSRCTSGLLNVVTTRTVGNPSSGESGLGLIRLRSVTHFPGGRSRWKRLSSSALRVSRHYLLPVSADRSAICRSFMAGICTRAIQSQVTIRARALRGPLRDRGEQLAAEHGRRGRPRAACSCPFAATGIPSQIAV